MKEKQTVFVGLSGGVDSSVAALRLINQGYKVVGVFIKVWQPDFLECNWEQERLDAMRVAAHLGIPFLTCNAEEAYKKDVADYFIESYKNGVTPNPDVMCNQYVKFGAFLDFAKNKGADFIATGHYATKISNSDGFSLMRGVDTNKDQTYFLWTLTQMQLKHTLLPVGNSEKKIIRAEAAVAGIPVADKKDSQGVCFLGHIDIPEFLSHFVELKKGDVLNEAGIKIGSHFGALIYTLGQRHGFTITEQNSQKHAYYVTGKDLIKNTITVSEQPLTVASESSITLNDCNWITKPIEKETYQAQFRYRQSPFAVNLNKISEHKAELSVVENQEKPASGQSCVLYRGNECIGGGIIR